MYGFICGVYLNRNIKESVRIKMQDILVLREIR